MEELREGGRVYQGQEVSDKDGRIYLDGERVIMTSPSVFGILRKELEENISYERMKGFLIRYGWNLGKNDAKNVLKKNRASIEELLKQGPALHMMRGYTKAKRVGLQIEYGQQNEIDHIHVEGIWTGSYEAEAFLEQTGKAEGSVCHTLVGYASGYYSEICKKKIIFKEEKCKAGGHDECYYVGKTLSDWDDTIGSELKYYEDDTILRELEMTYDKLLEERDALSRTFKVHEKLTSVFVDGKDMQSIVRTIFEETGLPVLIEDERFKHQASEGLDQEALMEVYNGRKEMKDTDLCSRRETTVGNVGGHNYITTPIILQKKCYGFCSFIVGTEYEFTRVDNMNLERLADICSLYILNEKTTFEALERIKGHFLDRLIEGKELSEEELLKQSRYIQADLNKPYHMMTLKYDDANRSHDDSLLFYDDVLKSLQNYCKNASNILVGQRSGNIVMMVQQHEKQSRIISVAERTRGYLKERFPEEKFQMGISTLTTDIGDAHDAYEEALTALKMLDGTNKKFLEFGDISVPGLLIHTKNKSVIRQKTKQVLGPLYKDNDEFLHTLYVFLSNGGNLEKSSQDLSLSLSGLRYRVKRIQELIGRDLRDPQTGYELLLTLQVMEAEGLISF
ncbi:XylR N-terminal domain-containing protein [Salinicoccus bachuensis]|uniref:XylR N-terminal domain-containing protein n=1 Tax=Salinicoccus bachuensis TaxID=3136731 RepID=A0ABZ3CHS7_9STAP